MITHNYLIYNNKYTDFITEIVQKNPKTYHRIIKKEPDVLEWLINNHSFTDYIPEMVYSVLNPEDSAFCGSGNRRKFRNISIGWNRCDDKFCKDCISKTLSKTAETNLKRYGETNPMKNNKVKEKIKHTLNKNPNIQLAAVQKRKETLMNRYGVDHYWKTEEGQQKRKESLLNRYGVENPSQNVDLQEKKKNTFIEKYGVDHPMKCKEIQDKVQQTFFEKFGVSNPSKVPEIRKKASLTMIEKYGCEYASQNQTIKHKIISTCLQKYGVEHPSRNQEIKQKSKQHKQSTFFYNLCSRVEGKVTPNFLRDDYQGVEKKYSWICNECDNEFNDDLNDGNIPTCPICFPGTKSRGQQEVSKYITSLGFDVIDNSRSIIAPLEIDIFIPVKNLAIEFNGIYFHSELSGNKDRNYHKNKQILCQQKGIDLIQIYDIEWKLKQEIVKSRLAQKLGKSCRIYARKCYAQPLDSARANTFIDANHIQGSCNSSINYGLFYNQELVAVMTFSRSRYNSSMEFELVRFCNKIGHAVIGAASKLLSLFEKEYNFPKIISYCDLRYNTGNLYLVLGFKLKSRSSPNYWYHKNNIGLCSRIKYQKHKLSKILEKFDHSKTEWENMVDNGYDRIWDCGSLVFVKN